MAGNKLNIPTPDPIDFKTEIFGFKNIAVGKVVNRLPQPYQAVANNALRPPSPQDIISDFLTRMPEPQDPVQKPELNVPIISSPNPTPTVAGAALNGSPLFTNLEIESNTWTDYSGQTKGYSAMTFNTVIMSCRQQKNIVETQIQGSEDGAVFEYSGLNNYDVTINIIITGNANGYYPLNPVQEIIKMLKSPYPIKVNSWFLQMLDITELVILDHDLNQIPGGISQQPITITAKSNKRTVLIIQ